MVPWLEDFDTLDSRFNFPDSRNALTQSDDADGLLCASASISAQHLLHSYPLGIYPWYTDGDPVLWWTPSQRAVLFTAEFKLHKSLRKTIAKYQASGRMQVRIDTAFSEVLAACAQRAEGTWITDPVVQAYTDLHASGHAHSIETWLDGALVGGFYGVSGHALGSMFYGESMFSRVSDASKIALACFVQWFTAQGGDVMDCQQDTAHLLSLGARCVPRAEFEAMLAHRLQNNALDWKGALSVDLLAMFVG